MTKVEPGDILTRLQKENERLRKDLKTAKDALLRIARVTYAGPSTDDRREWVWSLAYTTFEELK